MTRERACRGSIPISRAGEIARRIAIAPSTVRTTIRRFQAAGLSWPLPETCPMPRVEVRLFPETGTKQGHCARKRVGFAPRLTRNCTTPLWKHMSVRILQTGAAPPARVSVKLLS